MTLTDILELLSFPEIAICVLLLLTFISLELITLCTNWYETRD